MKDVERIKIMGIDVDKVTNEDVLVYFDDCMNEDRCHHIVTLNPEMILEAQHNSAFKELLETADLKFPDGIGLVYASKIVGSPLKERVYRQALLP